MSSMMQQSRLGQRLQCVQKDFRHKAVRPRTRLATVATERSVFQLEPAIGQPSMTEVREAYEVCAMHSDKDGRQQCYECFGLDGQRVDRYYHVVTDMENAFNVSDDEPSSKEEESPAAAALSFFRLFASMTVAFMGFVLALSAGMLAGLFALQTRDRQRELVHK